MRSMIAHSKDRPNIEALRVEVDYRRCYSCGACVAVCPPDSIFLDNLHLTIDDQTCTRCGRCLLVCPVEALHMAEATPEHAQPL